MSAVNRLIIIFALLSLLGTNTAWAAGGGDFLRFPASVAAAGAGNVITVSEPSGFSSLNNPGALAWVDGIQVESSYYTYISEVSLAHTGVSLPLGKSFGVGGAFSYEWMPPFDSTEGLAESVSVAEWAANGSVGYRVTESTGLGFGGRYFSSSLGSYSSQGYGVDFGAYMRFLEGRLVVGERVLNLLSHQASYLEGGESGTLTQEVRTGISWGQNISRGMGANFMLEYALADGERQGFCLGVDSRFYGLVNARVGYQIWDDAVDLGGLNNLSLGLGFGQDSYRVDYALLSKGDLGYTHRAGILYRFSGSGERRDNERSGRPLFAGLKTGMAKLGFGLVGGGIVMGVSGLACYLSSMKLQNEYEQFHQDYMEANYGEAVEAWDTSMEKYDSYESRAKLAQMVLISGAVSFVAGSVILRWFCGGEQRARGENAALNLVAKKDGTQALEYSLRY